jgi:ketopantoate hydroxymethyltransferase
MYNDINNYLLKKKTNKEKIFSFSFLNKIILNLYYDYKIDILRFDLDEFSELYGFKDFNRISANVILPLIDNITYSLKTKPISKYIAIDVPLTEITGENNYSLKKVIDFYQKSNADILNLNINFNALELVNKLTKMKIPVIVYAKNNSINHDNDQYYQEIHNKMVEAESMGAILLILEKFPTFVIQNLKKSVLIPIISDEKDNKIDGFYAKFSYIFGLINHDGAKYLNLKELIKDAIADCITDN